jgi:dihydropteroate synthase
MIEQETVGSVRTLAEEFILRLSNGGTLALGGAHRTRVMGVLNVTPDSFSDGGRFSNHDRAVAHGVQMAAEGADLIDIGGESTRPGAEPVPPAEQIARVVPVIERLSAEIGLPLSIDTTSAEVAEKALDAGAQIINDISALRDDPKMARLADERKALVVLMHIQGCPRDMQVNPVYRDVVAEVARFLADRVDAAVDAGIPRERLLIDPGFGFGKLFEHNMVLLRRLDTLCRIGRPVLVGTSRKAMIGRVLDLPPEERLYGTLATIAAAVQRGASMVRVHDVRPAVHLIKMLAAIEGRDWN